MHSGAIKPFLVGKRKKRGPHNFAVFPPFDVKNTTSFFVWWPQLNSVCTAKDDCSRLRPAGRLLACFRFWNAKKSITRSDEQQNLVWIGNNFFFLYTFQDLPKFREIATSTITRLTSWRWAARRDSPATPPMTPIRCSTTLRCEIGATESSCRTKRPRDDLDSKSTASSSDAASTSKSTRRILTVGVKSKCTWKQRRRKSPNCKLVRILKAKTFNGVTLRLFHFTSLAKKKIPSCQVVAILFFVDLPIPFSRFLFQCCFAIKNRKSENGQKDIFFFFFTSANNSVDAAASTYSISPN